MSKAYEMISESLNEIIRDLEENDGKNLTREVIKTEKVQSELKISHFVAQKPQFIDLRQEFCR